MPLLKGTDSAWTYINQGNGPQKAGAHTHTISGSTASAGTGDTGSSGGRGHISLILMSLIFGGEQLRGDVVCL